MEMESVERVAGRPLSAKLPTKTISGGGRGRPETYSSSAPSSRPLGSGEV